MNKEPLSPELSQEELQQFQEKCDELAKQHNVGQVHCCVQIRREDGSNERIVSYIKEPNYMTKLALMDKAAQLNAVMMASEELRLLCQIKEESHPLTYSENWQADKYKLGVTKFCAEIIELAQNEYTKKKNDTP